MKIPPKKPQFFKPILPGFKQGIEIPIGFWKYLKKDNHNEYAILKRAGKKWRVNMNEFWKLEDGNWKEFVETNSLQLGDLMIFQHEGNMEFEVSILDSSHCKKEYAEYLYKDNATLDKLFESKEPQGSHFECIIRPYCLKSGYLRLPEHFALANDLANKKYDVIIRDERNVFWDIKLVTYDSRVVIRHGWREFLKAKNIKEGDRVMFEVVTNEKEPIWQFHSMPNNNIKSLSSEAFAHTETPTPKPFEATTTHNPQGSHFVCTVPSFSFKTGYLLLPEDFVLENDLANKNYDLIIKDQRNRSWNLKLGTYGRLNRVIIEDKINRSSDLKLASIGSNQVNIGDGILYEFIVANELKMRDRVMFEVLTKGDKPIWQFHGKISQ